MVDDVVMIEGENDIRIADFEADLASFLDSHTGIENY